MNTRPIGIFDSGVGGLSVLLEIKKLLPNESYIFLADQSYMPYGEKTKEQLLDRVTKIMEFFENKNAKAVVAACNTATVYTIDEIREHFTVPIVGTVPVIKTLAQITKTKRVAVFATPATTKSSYLQNLIAKFAGDIEVLKIGGSNLEELVETGHIDSAEVKAVLRRELLPIIEDGVDAVALGCTHYPFLRQQIEELVGSGVRVVDSGGAVARRLKEILTNNDDLNTAGSGDNYYTTGEASTFKIVAERLMNQKIASVEHVEL